jgi:hypothetical protein
MGKCMWTKRLFGRLSGSVDGLCGWADAFGFVETLLCKLIFFTIAYIGVQNRIYD